MVQSVKAASEAARSLPENIEWELIVVDDSSTDGSIEKVKELDATILQMSSDGPHGPAVARNKGVSISRGEIIAFLDADVVAEPDTFTKMLDTFDLRPDIEALFGSYDDEPAARNFISQYKNLFHHFVHQNSQEESSSFWAGCGAIRKDTFEKAGGFPETRSKPAIEDIELGYKLSSISAKTLLRKEITVKHLKKWTLYSLLKTDIFSRGIPWTLLLMRTRPVTEDSSPRYANQISMVLLLMLLLTSLVSITTPKALILLVPFSGLFLYLNWGFYRFFGTKVDLNLQTGNRICVALVYLILVSLVYVPNQTWVLASTVTMLAFFIYLNLGLYEFFLEKRGAWFLTRALFMHLLYYFYNGLSFLAGAFIHLVLYPTGTKQKNAGA